MIASNVPVVTPDEVTESNVEVAKQRKPLLQKRGGLHFMAWVCLLLACIGASWFSYQYFLVPQPKDFAPSWGGAQWVQAADGNGPVAYFRYSTDLNVVPDSAFVTVAANQVFHLYVNGTLIGSNDLDFLQGNVSQAYIYDVTSVLLLGPNVIALRVANLDKQIPSVRVGFGSVHGSSVSYLSTGDGWQATAQSANVYPRYATSLNDWTGISFDASAWLAVKQAATPSLSPVLRINPLLYQRPDATQWVSADASRDAYFVRQVTLPAGITHAWLRIVATGTADIYINGQLLIIWNAQAHGPQQIVADYFNDTESTVESRAGIELGVYDIAPYLHAGQNTIAVHVLAPGISGTSVGLDTLSAAMSMDMLVSDSNTWLLSDVDWHTSPVPVAGWTQGSSAALAWPLSIPRDRPGANSMLYLPNSNALQSVQFIPLALLVEVILFSVGAVVLLWLLISLLVLRRYYRSDSDALAVTSVAFLPALACEGLFVVLSREPQLTRPFPYTWLCGLVLILLVGAGCLLLWLNARRIQRRGTGNPRTVYLRNFLFAWLRRHWALIPIVLVAIPLIAYNLTYEPYWQDELTSYFAAKGILAHGIPVLPSGFLYLKGELYSYLLAFSMLIFGDQGGAPRLVSVVEYIVSLPLLYGVGCYFFNRRVALLATLMLALSPSVLLWGSEVRMYEQAQLLTILVVYVFHRALQEPKRAHLVYLAVVCTVVDYLSHEETFIILPAIVLCALVFSRGEKYRLPVVLREKHWWYAALIGASVIGLQLLLVNVTHPPILGTDQSQRPLIQLTTNNIPFYVKLLFFPTNLGNRPEPWITVSSLLAVAGCIWAMYRADARVKYCALFLLVSFLTLVLMFTLASDRYIYPLLPIYYLMGAYALLRILQALWSSYRQASFSQTLSPSSRGGGGVEGSGERMSSGTPLSRHSERSGESGDPWVAQAGFSPMKVMMAFTTSLACACVLLLPMLPISNYNLFISQEAGLSYHRHYPDYDAIGQYMQQHWQPGDVVISVSPAISILYYVGRVDYFFSLDRALYLFESNGHITDTPTGSSAALLSQDDFQAVLAAHTRIWIISDDAQYQSAVTKNNRFVFPPDFHIVYEGYQSAIYFRGT